MAIKGNDQLGMDEHVVEDRDAENALEARQNAKDRRATASAAYDEAHEAALGAIARVTADLPEGVTVRIGRFRISRTQIEAKHIEFDSEARSALRIGLVPE